MENKKINLNKILNILIDRVLDKIENLKTPCIILNIKLENFVGKMKGKNVYFSYDKTNKLFIAREQNHIRYHYNRKRFFWLYRNGIVARSAFLFKSYCLNKVKFKKNDLVIDCGANSGDLYLSLSLKKSGIKYYAFEPNPNDFAILKKNLPLSKKFYNCALGAFDKSEKLFVSSENGDSSLVKPLRFSEEIVVEAIKLSTFVKMNKIKVIKLLKIEAEGFEPEVLLGSEKALPYCKYIAIDGGYERGVKKEETFSACTNFLTARRFKLIDIYFPWCRGLFKNERF